MTIKQFLQLVEIRTKVASVIPFLIGTVYTLYAFDTFNVTNALLMFISMLIFDMTTTAINNYVDYTTAIKKSGYGYEVHNAIGQHKLSPKLVRNMIFAMLTCSALLGLILFLRTNFVVLLLGMVCFIIGIIYTFGPLPISRTPFGEAFSGVTMGFILTFITIYIHIFNENILALHFSSGILTASFNLHALIGIFIICIPLICTIANIMLANNLCDMEDDLINKRYTLPLYIEKNAGLILWQILYYMSYMALLIGILLNYLPWTVLITLSTLIPITKNIKLFKQKQIKSQTFILSVKNFMCFNSMYFLTLSLGLLLKYFLG